MSAKMSSRERILAAIQRQKPDHVPLHLYTVQGPLLAEPLFWQDQIGRAKRLLELGLDPTIDIWFPDPQPDPSVEIKTWRARKGDEILITKEYHTPAGVLRQVVRETEDWCDFLHGPWVPTTWGTEKRHHFGIDLFDDWNVPRRVEPWFKGREDLDKLRYLIRPASGHILDEWRMDAERAMECAERLDLLTMARRTIVGDAFQWFCDLSWFMTQLHDDPAMVREFLGIFQDLAMSNVRLALEIGVDVVQYRGWYETPGFWGRNFWKEFLAPCIREQANLVHSARKLMNYIMPEGYGLYAEVLQDMPIDVLQGIDPAAMRDSTLQNVYATLGERKSFWGGVNSEITLQSQDYDKIEKEVREAIDVLGAGGGLILSSFIFAMVPVQGVLHMIDAWKKHATVSDKY